MKKQLIALLAPVLAAVAVSAATLPEPATTFYGKVLGTGDVQPFLITEGRLTWVIRRADGVDVTLTAALFAYGDGAFSYRLDVPHAALSLGLSAGASSVPLALSEQTHRHQSVTLDGEPVTLLGPAGSAFTTAQILRSATYRLDLGLDRKALDTDGDGIPDWWEDQYGLDKQANDAGQTFGIGGLTAAQCYARGLDPNADHTIPALLTPETVVYAGGDTALILEVADLDTPASNLVYTVTALPFGRVWKLEAGNPQPAPLAVGDTFTQTDVLAGRVVYRHDAEVTDPGVFGLTVCDGGHDPVPAPVRLLLYEPAINEVSLRSDLYQLAHAGFIVAEGGFIEASGATVSYALSGSDLSGGSADDVLIHNPSSLTSHATLSGGPGADRFVITDFASGTVTITDFSVAEGDTLDITAFAPLAGGTLSQHAALSQHTLVFDTGLTVAMPSLDAAEADLYALVAAGALLTDLPLAARVSIVATAPTAYRNGPRSGMFSLVREGDASQAITVNLKISGSAQNGADYENIADNVAFAPGQTVAEIAVTPYVAGGSYQVVARLEVLPGTGYHVGTPSSANVAIEPRKPEVAVAAFKPYAAQASAESGLFLLWRDTEGGLLTVPSLLGGDAVRNTDYLSPDPTTLFFAAGETEKLIEIAVKPSADLSAGPKSVTLAPKPDSRYFINPEYASAAIALIERYDTFEEWLARNGYGYQTLRQELDSPLSADRLFKLYAFGGQDGFPRPSLVNGRLEVTVRQRAGLLDVAFSVRGFTDLTDPAGTHVPVSQIASGIEWKTYRLETDGPRGFIAVDLLDQVE